MNINIKWTIIVIAVCALITLAERAAPFIIFRGKKTPAAVEYLGRVLPMAIIATLVFYCLKSVSFASISAYVPQLAATVLTVVLHLWKGNTMLSIAGGTICCMALTQLL